MKLLGNFFGLLAILAWTISIQNKEKKQILTFQTAANLLYSTQYFFLNATTACIMNFIAAIRSLIFYLEENKKGKISPKILSVFVLITIIIGIITYENFFSLIPVIVTLIYMYSVWQNNLDLTRYLFILAALLLVYHNFKVGAYVSIIGNLMDIISGIIAIIRFKISKKSP